MQPLCATLSLTTSVSSCLCAFACCSSCLRDFSPLMAGVFLWLLVADFLSLIFSFFCPDIAFQVYVQKLGDGMNVSGALSIALPALLSGPSIPFHPSVQLKLLVFLLPCRIVGIVLRSGMPGMLSLQSYVCCRSPAVVSRTADELTTCRLLSQRPAFTACPVLPVQLCA